MPHRFWPLETLQQYNFILTKLDIIFQSCIEHQNTVLFCQQPFPHNLSINNLQDKCKFFAFK